MTSRLHAELSRLTAILLGELGAQDHWSGELSSSALSTAVATVALGQIDLHTGSNLHAPLIESGLRWLAQNANADGGWGDTIRSRSNISTTALCRAAFAAAGADSRYTSTIRAAEHWLIAQSGSLAALPTVIADRYGTDRTFSIPILMTLAISGWPGPAEWEGWRGIPGLPFELAVLPRGFFGALKLPVVSYALPALIAIGQAIHHHAPSPNPLARILRKFSRARTLRLLCDLQPPNGGFLEATPLTAFVTMALASSGNPRHAVAQKAAQFLRASIRPDGSWPIDTNLATWVTTLSIKALAPQSHLITTGQKERLREWLLTQQTQVVHPYTGAAPGAWAWTDLPGGVPDADDTAGALLAIAELGQPDARAIHSAEAGIRWLLDLQNSDGGIPTFCRGWGHLPFDRSTPEITAHALRAWVKWRPLVNPRLGREIDAGSRKALRYLEKAQGANGSFLPLWFGNEHAADEANPVYGTAQVLIVLNDLESAGFPVPPRIQTRAAAFLAAAQKPGGEWGGDLSAPGSVEETALAVEALAPFEQHSATLRKGMDRLLHLLQTGAWQSPSPSGLYFARLWYYERLYPLIFSVSALGRIAGGSKSG
jgi:squalene-hopene/tetraprenyl-beta-curcumene cyclase